MPRDRIELDLRSTELRFDSRFEWNRGRWRGWRSRSSGLRQIVPCIVVAAPGSQDGEVAARKALVLIDGYRRVGARCVVSAATRLASSKWSWVT